MLRFDSELDAPLEATSFSGGAVVANVGDDVDYLTAAGFGRHHDDSRVALRKLREHRPRAFPIDAWQHVDQVGSHVEVVAREGFDILYFDSAWPTLESPRVVGHGGGEWDDFRVQCHDGGVAWGFDGEALRAIGPGLYRQPIAETDRPAALDCRGSTVLLLERRPDRLVRCSFQSCVSVFRSPTRVPGVAALLDDKRWVYAAAIEGVVGVWVEGVSHPMWARIPDAADLIGLSQHLGHLYLVASAPGAISEARQGIVQRLYELPANRIKRGP